MSKPMTRMEGMGFKPATCIHGFMKVCSLIFNFIMDYLKGMGLNPQAMMTDSTDK